MSGGTTKIVKVVTQKDVDEARKQLLEEERDAARRELAQRFGEDEYIFDSSFTETVQNTTAEPPVGEDGDSGRVILQVQYVLYGVNRGSLDAVVRYQQEQALESGAELGIVDSGLDTATIEPVEGQDSSVKTFRLSTEAVLGPDFDYARLTEELAGMKYVDAIERLESNSSVTKASIDLSPFWNSKLPRNPEKIEITVEVPEPDA